MHPSQYTSEVDNSFKGDERLKILIEMKSHFAVVLHRARVKCTDNMQCNVRDEPTLVWPYMVRKAEVPRSNAVVTNNEHAR